MGDPTPDVLAVDTGGTFTDYLALFETGETRFGKIPSTPDDPSQSVQTLFHQFDVNENTTLVHGTTVATNALLEDDLADVLLVTNHGLEGMLAIGRGERKELYNLNPDLDSYPFRNLPVVGVRLRDHPMLDDPGFLSERESARIRNKIREISSELIAICLVHSYRDPEGELSVEKALEPLDTPVVRSSNIVPLFREVERAGSVVLNASLRPIVSNYLQKIQQSRPSPGTIRVMGSSRGTLSVTEATTVPVRTALSGPVGGLLGTREIVPDGEQTDLITMDTGGTSTDVSFIPEGRISLRDDHEIGKYPIGEPMADIHTIGSGGGSMLWIDAGGHLRVGPRSAGAKPGPACYGRGGPPTVTDVLVFLGRIPTDRPLSEEIRLEYDLAQSAIEHLADQLDETPEKLARGALEIVLTQLAEALRSVTVQRGTSPKGIPLVAFGGGGGLHGALLAERVNIEEVYIPRIAGVASTIGLLGAPDCHKRTISPMSALDPEHSSIPGENDLRARAPDWTEQADSIAYEASCQFKGQNHTLDLPIKIGCKPQTLAQQFQQTYREQYGYLPSEETVEVVHLRGFWFRKRSKPDTSYGKNTTSPVGEQKVFVEKNWQTIPCWELESVTTKLSGPALLTGETTTVYVPRTWGLEPEKDVVRLVQHG